MADRVRSVGSRGFVFAVLMTALIALGALGVAMYAVLNLPSSPSSSSSSSLLDGRPHIVSEDDLRALGAERGPVYWAGPRDDTDYELTVTSSGAFYVRYLPQGSEAGGSKSKVLTVANYAVSDGYDRLVAWGDRGDRSVVEAKSGAAIVTDASDDSRAYFAFPTTPLQVEVFDPEAGVAEKLASNGSLVLLKEEE